MGTRRERVVLELEDGGFSSKMVKDAAATGLLERALKSLDGTNVTIHERLSESATRVDGLTRSSNQADGSINQLTGRLRVLGEVAAVAFQTVGPLGGVALAGLSGLASQLGFAAVAGGVLIGSMQGLGDALSAMNDAHLNPTNANLEKQRNTLQALSPEMRKFARELYGLMPVLKSIRDAGAEGLVPGLSESLDSLERLGPRVAEIFEVVGGALGDIADDSAASLASERWEGFFEFIVREAPDALRDLAATIGSVTHGAVELWEALTPLNDDFSAWLRDTAAEFDGWATGLDQTATFQEFIDYVRTTGPQVEDTVGAIANAVIQLVQASAPLGGPVLAGLENVSEIIANIADSDLGTPIMVGVTALALLNRTLAITAALSKTSLSTGIFAGVGTLRAGIGKQAGGIKADLLAMSDTMVAFGANTEKAGAAADRMKGRVAALAKGGAALGAIALASSGAADGIGLTNTMTLALAGSIAGVPGAAIGGAVGLFLDWRDAAGQADEQLKAFQASLQGMDITQLNDQLASRQEILAGLAGQDFAGADDLRSNIGDQVDLLEDQIDATNELAAARENEQRAAAMAYAESLGINISASKAAKMSVEDIKAQADALKSVRDAGQQTAESFLAYGDALDDAKVSLGEWITNQQKAANALANFNNNSIKAAKRGLDEGLVESLRGAGKEGALRMKQLADASESEIRRANKAYRSQQAELERTKDITQRLANLSPVKVNVDAETGRAITNIRSLEARLRAIKDEDVFVNVRHRQYGKSGGFGPVDYYNGGFTGPGGRLEPRGVVHAGEVVIPQDLVQRDWSMLSSRYGHLPGFADGGVVPDSDKKDGKRKQREFAGGIFMTPELANVLAEFGTLARAIRKSEQALDAQTAAQNATAAAVDTTRSAMEDLAKATTSGFMNDPFRQRTGDSPWTAGARGGGSDPIASLLADIAYGEERGSLQQQLVAAGLGGKTPEEQAALDTVLRQGDNAALQALLANGQVQMIEDLLIKRDRLEGTVGGDAAQLAYGEKLQMQIAEDRAQTSVMREMQQDLKELQHISDVLEQIRDDAPKNAEKAGAGAAGAVVTGGNKAAKRRRRDG